MCVCVVAERILWNGVFCYRLWGTYGFSRHPDGNWDGVQIIDCVCVLVFGSEIITCFSLYVGVCFAGLVVVCVINNSTIRVGCDLVLIKYV